jgi:hypothetical protein
VRARFFFARADHVVFRLGGGILSWGALFRLSNGKRACNGDEQRKCDRVEAFHRISVVWGEGV